ncbi:MAG TPA: hypothetical protein VGG74_21295 [Kofleriaceae bacterium]|jgi:hypothetical protein
MAIQQIPLQQGVANYRVGVTLDGVAYLFDLSWNAYDESWWLSVYDATEAPIRTGIKCVLGTFLGRTCQTAPFFVGALVCYDTSGQQLDAAFNDFGTRVKMAYLPAIDLIAFEQTPDAFSEGT